MEEIYTDLDVPLELKKEAETKYLNLGEWLNQDSQSKFKSDSQLYIQGSTLLGTSVRPIKRGDEYDFDLVYKRNIKKDGISQKDFKDQVGEQLTRYIQYLKDGGEKDIPFLIEGKRCWTLQYKGRFHIDVLPALPDPEPEYLMDPEDGLIITDKELTQWQFSNPKGYHSWFKKSMRYALTELRNSLAKSDGVEVEDVPQHKTKTTLQKAIQILKRHRDSTYMGSKDDKPISVIITTLASHAYNNSDNLYVALTEIVKNMNNYIEDRDGVYWVENPINKKENFADKWESNPKRAEEMFRWIESANKEFESYQNETNIDVITESLEKSFRLDNATAITGKAKKREGLAVAAKAVEVKTDPWSHSGDSY